MALAHLVPIASILLGAAAGAGDTASGVFRSLVATGRSRASLFLARVPAGLMLVIPLAAVAFAMVAFVGKAFADGGPTPSWTLILETGLWIELQAVMLYLLANGFASLTGSRFTTVGVLLALVLVATPLIEQISWMPNLRQAVLGVPLDQLRPKGLDAGVGGSSVLVMTVTAICIDLVAWAALSIGIGCWRTTKRDA